MAKTMRWTRDSSAPRVTEVGHLYIYYSGDYRLDVLFHLNNETALVGVRCMSQEKYDVIELVSCVGRSRDRVIRDTKAWAVGRIDSPMKLFVRLLKEKDNEV
jgi:hypothetical protein